MDIPSLKLYSPERTIEQGYRTFNHVPHICLPLNEEKHWQTEQAIVLYRPSTSVYHLYSFIYDKGQNTILIQCQVGSTSKEVRPATKTLAFFLDKNKKRKLPNSNLIAHISKPAEKISTNTDLAPYVICSEADLESINMKQLLHEIPFTCHIFNIDELAKQWQDHLIADASDKSIENEPKFNFTVTANLPDGKQITFCYLELFNNEMNIDIQTYHTSQGKDTAAPIISVDYEELNALDNQSIYGDMEEASESGNEATYIVKGRHLLKLAY